MDLKSFEIAVGLFDCRRADIVPRADIGKFGRFYSTDPDIVRQLDHDLAGRGCYFKRLFFDCRDLSPDCDRLTLRRLRLSCVELNDTDKRNESDKPERVDSYSLSSHLSSFFLPEIDCLRLEDSPAVFVIIDLSWGPEMNYTSFSG